MAVSKAVSKVSDINVSHLAEYLRVEYGDMTEEEISLLETLLESAKAYICYYTGLTDEEIDKHRDMIIVVYILVQDAFDNRGLYVHTDNTNKTVDTILGMHRVNLL